jgi:hypothetical protein
MEKPAIWLYMGSVLYTYGNERPGTLEGLTKGPEYDTPSIIELYKTYSMCFDPARLLS